MPVHILILSVHIHRSSNIGKFDSIRLYGHSQPYWNNFIAKNWSASCAKDTTGSCNSVDFQEEKITILPLKCLPTETVLAVRDQLKFHFKTAYVNSTLITNNLQKLQITSYFGVMFIHVWLRYILLEMKLVVYCTFGLGMCARFILWVGLTPGFM